MNDFTINDLKSLEINLSHLDLLYALVIAAICAEVISLIYKRYAQTIGNRESFANIFIESSMPGAITPPLYLPALVTTSKVVAVPKSIITQFVL